MVGYLKLNLKLIRIENLLVVVIMDRNMDISSIINHNMGK
jgi:hypothetical protein